jgi:hypothetical protein
MKNISTMVSLPDSTQMLIRGAFADGYQRQLLVVLGFCAGEVLALGMMWERPMKRLV